MPNIEYSKEAEEAKGLFYNKSFTVYVEGDDDVLFWSYLFKLAGVDAHIEDVGGNEEISKKIKDILDNNATFLVACDSDHSKFKSSTIEHERILKTYGYSIENSMYTSHNVEKAIINLAKKPKDLKEEIKIWMTNFSNSLYDLLAYDIANHVYDKGIQIFGNNCQRFLENGTSKEISNELVTDYITNIKDNFSTEEISYVKGLLSMSDIDLWFHLKGHFITHGVINLIQHHVKSISGSKCNITLDSLYALTIDCTSNWKNRIDIKTMVSKIEKLKQSV